MVIKINDTNKLSAKVIKGPNKMKKVLPNDRYVITDIKGFQVSHVSFNSVYTAQN